MADRVFELRTYRSAPGKLDALKARFRDHTLGFFADHGIDVAVFLEAADEADPTTGTLVYLCTYPSREAAATAWAAFQIDERWRAARAASEVDGPLTASVESLYCSPTDFSVLR
jgi:hypothetical protein